MNWAEIIFDSVSPAQTWQSIFAALLDIAKNSATPFALHDETVSADRLISEAAWELWQAYPQVATRTTQTLREWCSGPSAGGRAVLVLDALSLRELPMLLRGARQHGIQIQSIQVTGAEVPSLTDQFARALGCSSRGALANDAKPGTLLLFAGDVYTDVTGVPFEDYPIPHSPNIIVWHTWLDDLIHLQNRLPEQVAASASSVLQGDGFWKFVNKIRKGRRLVITSDHGYAVSKLFSSEVTDPEAHDLLRNAFGASRYKSAEQEWDRRFMPPLVMSHNQHHVIMGQWKWKVQGGFPHICHGGMSLLEVAVPFVELTEL
ncbi:MAG: hypothetical protein HPY55_01280 [Firmicutes bacterium]|nr:hypothetical protein [Bacillota bacterium]